ncbi:P-loop containing nucleoside triphosphate hydrolase protein [Eremomyces bilateralis CBS 781.70]|uniref:P-loop containing nucleoside triphosphate hydrolase protein n=1 Tax=Eremomyces bilateralis CBS 781.70 TaxID=1392243 RepID=A0A6G1FXP0_9PEZI|nr:P-loop containing nucleoside triphosphate hydrolase protein [Eremomyces bilateralis CBS 781.70]KAF1810436.1 P-loop containing nucleoside triphosphate hydrolase protein [Eremomyces bilateralis CBS 781.70]
MPIMIMFEKGKVAAVRLCLALDQTFIRGRRMERGGDVRLERCVGDIEFKKVAFAYPTRPEQMALRDASLFFPAGEMTFVIGKSGSGKSTLGQLLAGFYYPSKGDILLDGHGFETLDMNGVRENITLVQQESILFSGTIRENIALGSRSFPTVDDGEVQDAVAFSLLDGTIRDMAKGLETPVGLKGNTLSGGQRQRMAIARARLRDTPILILDESTSALDYINRSLIMDSIRKWRRGKTTIVITHDISQILPEDYVYVMKSGEVVQEGFRKSLSDQRETHFQEFLQPEPEPADVFVHTTETGSALSGEIDLYYDEDGAEQSMVPSFFTGRFGNSPNRDSMRLPPIVSPFWKLMPPINQSEPGSHTSAFALPERASVFFGAIDRPEILDQFLERTENVAANGRKNSVALGILGSPRQGAKMEPEKRKVKETPKKLSHILKTVWPRLPWHGRVSLVLAVVATVTYSAATPVFAFVFSKLLATYFDPSNLQAQARTYSLSIIGIAVGDVIALFCMYSQFHRVGQLWVNQIRIDAMKRILAQPRDFFDQEEYSVSKLTECLDNRAEEMQYIISRFVGNILVVTVMMSIAVVWSMTTNWKLTLVAVATAPIIYGVSSKFTKMNGFHDRKCNDASEWAASIFLETFSNIKTIRSLTIEGHFEDKYIRETKRIFRKGVFRAISGGCFFGLSESSFIYVTALIFHYSGVLVNSQGAPVAGILQVITLLLFSLTNIQMIIAFIPQLSEARDAATRLLKLSELPTTSHEDEGSTRISSIGDIHFSRLNFRYPSQPSQPILQDLSLVLPSGTCTALVGASGSGKSTVASLLVKLYTTHTAASSSGNITLSGRDIFRLHTPTLRNLITIVPQTPVLFPVSLADNIAYGIHPTSHLASLASIREAAEAAGIHEFISSLPQGYDTLVGDGGMGLSGGQAQRVAIARAIARHPRVLVLDEATASLDMESAGIIRDTVKRLIGEGPGSARRSSNGWRTATSGRSGGRDEEMTVLIITHAREMMSVADQIVMLEKGQVVEEGGFEELKARNGWFAKLLQGERGE